MAATGSKVTVFAAIAGNVAIAVTKLIAAIATGSSAMLSESIHSFVDTGDGGLLLLGLHRSQRPPDERHPFGHGKELYFWTLIVAILIFAVGGGISVYEGVTRIHHPEPLGSPTWNYVVLGAAALFEGISWTIARRELKRVKGRVGYLEAIHRSKDPTTFTVLLEDSAALLGLAIAFLGVFFGHRLHRPELDGAASVGIGLLLASIAVLLARESKGLLIGEGTDPATLAQVRRLVQDDPAVLRLTRALTMHFGPEEVLLALEIRFRPELSAGDVASAVERLDRAIRAQHPQMKYTFLEAQALAGGPKDSPGQPATVGIDRSS